MQRRVALWILRVFCTFLLFGIEAIAGLIPIYLYLQKLNGKFYLRVHTLLLNHIIKSLLKTRYMNNKEVYQLLLERLILRQWLNIKDLNMDMNNRFNEIFPLFTLFSSEFFSRDRLTDIFPSHFSFYFSNRKNKESLKTYLYNLNNIIF